MVGSYLGGGEAMSLKMYQKVNGFLVIFDIIFDIYVN